MDKNKKLKSKATSKNKRPKDHNEAVLKSISSKIRSSYTDEELEEERQYLCMSQGLSRYC